MMNKKFRKWKALTLSILTGGMFMWGGLTVHAAKDVPLDAWYHDAVQYAIDHDMMVGTSKEKFSPLQNLTRAQAVQVIYNMEQQPAPPPFKIEYDDVPSEMWYADAVSWAQNDGVAYGIADSKFGPDTDVTREQFVTFLYRYAGLSGAYNCSFEDHSIDSFPDKSKVNTWAEESVKWAVSNGIISGKKTGKGNFLDPQGNATRAECAQMLMNMKEKASLQQESLPEKFDLRDVIDIPVENQESFGLCWDFAAMKCLETNLALTKGLNYNFSEIHVAYMMSNRLNPNYGAYRAFDGGGYDATWLAYNLILHGFLPEAALEYRIYDESEYQKFGEMQLEPINVAKIKRFPKHSMSYHFGRSEATVENIKRQMKEHIMKYGSISTVVHMNATYIYNRSDKTNHAMSIIGWDDHISKEKFERDGIMPKKDGAFIVLNSWGPLFNDHGICYVSYEDGAVYTRLWGVVSADDKDLIDLDEEGIKLSEALQKKYPQWVINKDGKKYMNPLQFEDVSVLDLSGCGIQSLEGIEELKDIFKGSILDLSDNEITDVSPLGSMKTLNHIILSDNQVKDVSGLASCDSLRILELDGNKEVSGYGKLSQVQELSLKNCGLKSVENLEGMKQLSALDLSLNPLEGSLDFSGIWEVTLQECGLTSIPDLNKVTYCSLAGNPGIKDFSALKGKDFASLDLSNCGIVDGSVLTGDLHTLELNLSGNVGICNLDGLAQMIDETIILRDCQITDASVIGGKNWKHVDLSGNKGLHGKLDVAKLEVENCDLDDSFDFLGNESLEFLNIKGNQVSFEHILNGVWCHKLACDPLSVEECYKIPGFMEIENLEVYATMELPAHTKGQKLHLIPIVRHYFPYDLDREMDDISPYTSYTISEGQGIDLDSDWFTGKMQGDYAEVKFDMNIVDLFITRRILTFHLKLQVNDQLKPESMVVRLKEGMETAPYFGVGDKPNFDSYSVQVIYEGGYSEYVTDYEIIGNEELEFGENTYILKYGKLEEKLMINAYLKLNFETQEVFWAVLSTHMDFYFNGVVEKNTGEKWIFVNQRGKKLLEERIGDKHETCVPSSCIWDLHNLEGLISTKEVVIWYDGHKIDEADLEVLRKICNMDPQAPKPTLTICSSDNTQDLEEIREEVIVEQNDFNVVFYKEEPYEGPDDDYDDYDDEEVNDWDTNETVKMIKDLMNNPVIDNVTDELDEGSDQNVSDEPQEEMDQEGLLDDIMSNMTDETIWDEVIKEIQ